MKRTLRGTRALTDTAADTVTSGIRLAALDAARTCLLREPDGSHQGRTPLQNVAASGVERHTENRTTARKPACVGPLLTFMVRISSRTTRRDPHRT